VNAGSNISVTNVSVGSATQIMATFTPTNSASAGGNKAVIVASNGQTSGPENFFVQVPTFFSATNYNARIISGCASSGNGFFADLSYQVTDQNGSPIAVAGLTPQEHFTENGTPTFLGFRPFATPQVTPNDGAFDDTPIGSCLTTNPPGLNACVDVVQTFNVVVPCSSGATTYPINTQTTRRDCSFGQRVTVSPGTVFTSGTVN